MMNKKGLAHKISIGISIGVIGFIIMASGSVLNNLWLIIGGIVAVTFATWLITWK